MEYKEKIRLLREEQNLSQQDLANILGVNKQMISDVERGKQKRFNPQIEKKLKELFKIDLREKELDVKEVSDSARVRRMQEDLLLYYFSTLDERSKDSAFVELLKVIEMFRKV